MNQKDKHDKIEENEGKENETKENEENETKEKEALKAEKLKNCAKGNHEWAYFGSDYDSQGNRCNIQVCLVCDEVKMVNKRYHP